MTGPRPRRINRTRRQMYGRGVWNSGFEFILSGIGFTVGLGNIWRFPYLCYRNGGAAFLLPYFLSLVFVGLPLLFLELALGQFVNEGPIYIFGHIAPLFKGIGWGMICLTFFISLYYNVLIAWILFLLSQSFTEELPWRGCDNDYNTIGCYTVTIEKDCEKEEIFWNKSCIPASHVCRLHNHSIWNTTHCQSGQHNLTFVSVNDVANRIHATTEFFRFRLLGEPKNDDSMALLGNIQWELAVCLVIAWFFVAVCLAKGVQTSGKVVYFSVTFPYIIMFILLASSMQLNGSEVGLRRYMFEPQWDSLKNASVWQEATTQVIYSLGLALGVHSTLSSYNNIHQGIFRDAIIIAVMNSGTSLLAGTVVFSLLGNLAYELQVDIFEAADIDSYLTFIVLPRAVSNMDFSYLWSILTGLMLLLLGVDSQFSQVEAVTTALLDQWHCFRGYREYVVAGTCIVCCLVSLPMCTEKGILVFETLQWSTAGPSLVLIALLELLVVWSYGHKNLLHAMKTNLKLWIPVPLSAFWMSTWIFITPFCLIIIFVLSLYRPCQPTWKETPIPLFLQVTCYILSLSSFIIIIPYAIYRSIFPSTSIRDMLKPTEGFCTERERRYRQQQQQEREQQNRQHQDLSIELQQVHMR